MKRNILLSYILAFLYHSWFWLGIWVFYYLRFTDYAGIGIIESAMITLSIILEVPTGVLADTIGKRKTLMLAFLLSGISGIIFGITTSFAMLFISVILVAIGATCYSGTLETLQYDSLKDLKKEKGFDKVVANTQSIALAASAICSIIGGFLYSYMPGLPFLLVGVFQLIGFFVVFLIKEPSHDSDKFVLSTFIKNQLQGFKELGRTRVIRNQTFVLVGAGLFMIIASEMLDYVQGVEFGFQPQQFGLIAAGMYLLASFASQLTPFIHKFASPIIIVVTSACIVALTFLLSPILGIVSGGIVLAMRWSTQSIFDGGTSLIVNANVVSKYRATTLSSLKLLKNLPYAFAAYFLGVIMERSNARIFGFWLGIVMFIVIALTFYFERISHKNYSRV